ncbi:hypothetical protein [Halochromatium salexigens]|uniref:Uncharacterized protein n=1 Tax=Halochromatium salexigens TaxID=49447 RepID=A0AAJ0UI88_HALSE|nr:hypothetical protein [Halochromatium salexigens]MBK5931959.1 hypothetical protein [Halochromatium salexigens]
MSRGEQHEVGCRHSSEVDEGLWPSADNQQQVERLRAAVGEMIYVAELRETEVQLAVQLSDHSYQLLGVIEFPRPDPERGLAPHLILLDDGRGVNLGRIVRISYQPFQPAPEEVLYLDREADQKLLFADRRLSQRFISERRQCSAKCSGTSSMPSPAKLEQAVSVEAAAERVVDAGGGEAPNGTGKGDSSSEEGS